MPDKAKKIVGWVATLALGLVAFFGFRQLFPGYEVVVGGVILNAIAAGYILKERAYIRGVKDGAAKVNAEVEVKLREVVEHARSVSPPEETPIPFPTTKLNNASVNGRGRFPHSAAS